MESRDSSSSTPSNRDGPSGDDDGGLSVTAALAKDAALYFQSRKYAECLEVLNQLKQKKEDDPKILHNIAIAEYFRDGCSDPKKLLEVLNNVKGGFSDGKRDTTVLLRASMALNCISMKRSQELAQASKEQVDSASSVGIVGSKGSGNMVHQLSTNSRSVLYMDEFDTSVATLNIAVIWFHLHEYVKALSVLDPLYQNIEPIDETTALHTCLLLLDVVLACKNASKSADVLNYLEKAFGVSNVTQGDGCTMATQQSAILSSKSASIPSSPLATEVSNSDLTVNASENSLSRTLSEEPLDEMFATLDISGQHLSRPAGIPSLNDAPRSMFGRSLSTADLKLKLQLYKVQFLLLTRNLKLAKREVKHAMNGGRGRDLSVALLLKSQLEYTRGNHRKAIKLLMASTNWTETGISSMFNNNLGCIFYQLGKYHTSSVFFKKALGDCLSLRKEKPQTLAAFSQDKFLLITYNSGLQYLACGKPVLAARCFLKASLVFYKRPLLWLRLAECCLMALEKGLIKANESLSEQLEVRANVFGSGKWRQLYIDSGTSYGLADFIGNDKLCSGSDGQPKLSLPLARQCLYNALYLLDCSDFNNSKSGLPVSLEESELSEAAYSRNSNQKNSSIDSKFSTLSGGPAQVNSNGDIKELKGGSVLDIVQSTVSKYEGICRRENQMMKQAVLADLAYVELALENPLKALSAARSLLELPNRSRIYIFLCHLYAAEALCSLNRLKEAAEHLLIYMSGDNNVELPFGQEDIEQWRLDSAVDWEELNGVHVMAKNSSEDLHHGFIFLKPEEVRGTLYANLAATSAMQGDLERAHHFVMQALSLVPNSPEAIVTAIYVDLMLGKSQEALSKLKQCSHVRFLPDSLWLSKSF